MNPYEKAAQALLRESGCTVKRWRKSMSGVAMTQSPEWYIESPHPIAAISFSIFAHEVGHQMLHREGNSPRWLEEVEAWDYALAQFDRFDLAGRERVHVRAKKGIRYAFTKAVRVGVPFTRFMEHETARPWALEILREDWDAMVPKSPRPLPLRQIV